VVVVCQLDGYANGVRPVEIARHLRAATWSGSSSRIG
jgi:hypothetical protein